MKKVYLFFCVLCLINACNNRSAEKLERKGEPDIYRVKGDDEDMNQAIGTARETIEAFDSALKSGKRSYQKFTLKSKFNTPDGAEHIWVRDIAIKNGKYFGSIDNMPNSISELKIGDTVEILPENISDWMYIDSGSLRGGYTIRVLRNRMSAAE